MSFFMNTQTQNKSFPILYSKTKLGQIQTWQIFVEGDSFYIREGLMGGAITETLPNKCEEKNIGKKNYRSASDQAIAEATSKYEKKIKYGGYHENIEDVDSGKMYIEPMLAYEYKWSDSTYVEKFSKKLQPLYFFQPKLNGIRCLVTNKGAYSRKGNAFLTVDHIRKALQPVFDECPDIIIDGELYNHEFCDNFEELSGKIRRSKPSADDISWCLENLQLHIYDAFMFNGEEIFNKTYAQRHEIISEMVDLHPFIKIVETVRYETNGNFDEFTNRMQSTYQKYLDLGYEGMMIRTDDLYQEGRTQSLLKYKPFSDEEFVIIGFEESSGNEAGTLGKYICQTSDGNPFGAKPKGKLEFRRQLWQDRESLLGKKVTVRYTFLSKEGIPINPRALAIRDYE